MKEREKILKKKEESNYINDLENFKKIWENEFEKKNDFESNEESNLKQYLENIYSSKYQNFLKESSKNYDRNLLELNKKIKNYSDEKLRNLNINVNNPEKIIERSFNNKFENQFAREKEIKEKLVIDHEKLMKIKIDEYDEKINNLKLVKATFIQELDLVNIKTQKIDNQSTKNELENSIKLKKFNLQKEIFIYNSLIKEYNEKDKIIKILGLEVIFNKIH